MDPSKPQHGPLPHSADIITYRMGDKLVYVTPTSEYERAIGDAYAAFPEELSNVIRQKVALFITSFVEGKRKTVEIAPTAWTSILSTLARFEIVDIVVKEDKPPVYNESYKPEVKREMNSVRSPPSSRCTRFAKWCQQLF
ncbi:hypothetical protein PUNSTDRAFT_71906 [Punctularia strigosozonata HHB-11173 SS5]|uniref:uncharacterized protein n=1 Tax=Punctularia strigosozonata (strain HHB-11173) TaxID=741275 RepID=UPI0004416429|nr:uncharacterized protein PUNSTDRAFT_71906 [Punctularia strigosozonata HHB-11173 SS5]EIN06709.1 hypothetical protein PUNSTDRAFT_71906 [Punctularia strigosozonata HHB-11173 SS5]